MYITHYCNQNMGHNDDKLDRGLKLYYNKIFDDVLKTTYTFDNDNLHRNTTAMRER
jgi:hypothetical protein